MESKQTQPSALQFVSTYGIPPDLIGCHYIAKAIELYSPERYNFNRIYNDVAKAFSVKCKSVMRGISYAIQKSYNLREKLSDAFQIDIPQTEIHNSLVISYLSILWNKR